MVVIRENLSPKLYRNLLICIGTKSHKIALFAQFEMMQQFENMNKIAVIFICMGNICRSPTAEAVFRHQVEQAGLDECILIDSAGTHDFHIGDAPDLRAQRAAQQRGYDMSGLRGRQVGESDFHRFDYVLAMDKANLAILKRLDRKSV